MGLRSVCLAATQVSFLSLALSLGCGDSQSSPAGGMQTSISPMGNAGASAGPSPGAMSMTPSSEMPGDMPPVGGRVWFADDFESGASSNWDLTPGAGASFSVVVEPGTTNHVLQYTAGGSTDNLVALLADAVWAQTESKAGVTPLADYYVQARFKPQTNGTT